MQRTPILDSVSTKLQRIAELAKEDPGRSFLSLAHHIDLVFLREAYKRTRKDGAAGVDGQTAETYAKDLENNLQSLLTRFKAGTYKAPPVRRAYVPKNDRTQTRPIGIPCLEDKVLQRAVTMVLSAIYEQNFLDCSYGFRPGRSPHMALQALRDETMKMKGGWVIDVDVQDCFGSLDHGVLRSFLDKRVRDGVLRRAIDKWLKAGVMEDGHIHYPDSGSPQGGVISPVLANLYLHEVMDVWFEEMVKPVLRGQAFMIRFADDSIMVFALEDDARRVYRTLPKRFAKYGLTIHPDKTHLLRFRKPPRDARGKGDTTGGPRPATSDFLGFTHYWARSLQGYWVVKRKTAASRFVRALRRIADWCRRNRHRPVAEQHQMLIKKLRGHYEYYGITGNSTALARFRYAVEHTWKRWLERRSQRAAIGWDRFERFRERYPLPSPICAHSILRRVAKP